MAPDTTRKAVNLAAADARRAIEALQEQSTSLQRELAEARAEITKEKQRRVYYQDIVYSCCRLADRFFKSSTVCGCVEEPSTELQDRLTSLLPRMEQYHNRKQTVSLAQRGDVGVWVWGGDEHDHPESLTCPILINADQMRALLGKSALTPPTAASGEKAFTIDPQWLLKMADAEDAVGGLAIGASPLASPPPSAPAAESEGGEPEVLEAPDPDSLWDQLLTERNSLAARLEASRARLAACEERCKELEEGIERHRERTYPGPHSNRPATTADTDLWSLLAPKAEGGRAE